MLLYTLRRLTSGLVLAVVVTLITFLLLSTSFDSVVDTILGSGRTPQAAHALKAQMGLDRPVLVQYTDWLSHIVRGDFGTSYFGGQPVGPAVQQHLGVTLSVVITALVFTVIASVALGVLSATRAGAVDRVAQGISLVGYLVPNLLIAIVLVYVLAIRLSWLPATGYTPLTTDPGAWARSITIPVIALTIGGTAALSAQVRGSMIDELRKDYIRTLRTRGISTRSVVLRHALRNAAGPTLTVLSLQFVAMLGGALIIETVFALPGFGTYAFNASVQGDIPVIMAITLFSVLLVIVVNLVVDLANGWLNSKARIR
ncbi:ABC transporter permease [Streptomyces sp. NPDC048278]|uniref:ABC transporter permease n=1 Tax=Streptomyces sp. NPDC048278 TaxID=3155809 RepID=UPI00342F5262